MKTTKRFLLTLVAMGGLTGAWAQATEQEVALTKTATNEWTLTMPVTDVELQVVYAKEMQSSWLQDIPNQTYTGQAIEPTVVVKDGETTLTPGTDYTVVYADNVEVGTATVTVTATEPSVFSGSIEKTFDILADKTELTNALTEAQTYYNSIKNTYPQVAERLALYIGKAQNVMRKTYATQEEVDRTRKELRNEKARAEYNVREIVQGNLRADVNEAQAYQNSIKDKHPEAAAALAKAMDEASEALSTASYITVEDVKAAIAQLAAAKATAEQTVLTETKQELADNIAQAEGYYETIKTRNPQAADDLMQAINDGKAVKDNASATQAQVDAAIAALNSAVTDATVAIGLVDAIDAAQQIWDDSLNVGTKVFEYPCSAQNFLDDVIAQAAKVRDNPAATLTDVEAAMTELEKGIEAYRNLPLNAPAEGQLFNLVLTDTEADCEQADKAVTYVAGTDGTYAVQYLAEANKNLAQAFTFTQVENNNYTLSQIDADGVARYLCTDADGNIATTTDATQAMLVTVVPSQTQQGVYSLRNVAANQFIGSQDIDVSTVDQNNNFLLVETEKPAVSVNTTEAGWGTVMFPFAVASLPEGVKAYTCDAVEGTTLTLVEVEALEANRPYIVEGAWKATLTGDAQGTALEYTAGLLTGVYADTEAPAASYVLQNQDGNVAFYLVVEDASQPTVGAYHAYLTVDSSVKAFGLGEGETAIRSLQAEGEGSVIYNLSGQRVQKTQRGIYVVNGKKVIRK